jgi:FkbM family methyltransferase
MQPAASGDCRAFLVDTDIPTAANVYVYGVDDTAGAWLLQRLAGNSRFRIGGFIADHDGPAHGFPVTRTERYRPTAGDVVLVTDANRYAAFQDFSRNHPDAQCLNAVPFANIRFHESCAAASREGLRGQEHAHILLEVRAVVGFTMRFLSRDHVVFDIGSNTGGYIPLFRERGRAVHAFEPTPDLAATLRKTYVGRDDVKIIDRAVSDTVSRVPFYLDKRGATSGSSLNRDSPYVGEPIMVDTLRIDDYCAETGVIPGFVKIDVETYEVQVINGAWRTIETHRPIMIFEFWERQLREGYMELFERLSKYYRLVRTEDNCDALAVYRNFSGDGGDVVYNIGCLPL